MPGRPPRPEPATGPGVHSGISPWTSGASAVRAHPSAQIVDHRVTFTCDVAEVVRIVLEAADGKNVEVHSASIGAQLIERGLIDEIDLHIVPILLGDGVRLFDNPGGAPVRLDRVHDGAPNAELSVRFRPASRPTAVELAFLEFEAGRVIPAEPPFGRCMRPLGFTA